MTLPHVAVLMGGPDGEREVSLASGRAVSQALRDGGLHVDEHDVDTVTADMLQHIAADVFFPVLHGPWGEGGPLQEVLATDGRPFVGSGQKAAALCMDKARTKQLASTLGIPTPQWHVTDTPNVTPDITPPVVVKPNADGSSLGLHLCNDVDAMMVAVRDVLTDHQMALIEHRITGRELTVGIVDDQALPIIEISPFAGVYDYEAKYDRNDTAYLIDPPLPAGMAADMCQWAIAVCRQAGVRDLARVDFMVDDRGSWLLEVNTIPGFTAHSLLPKAAGAHGWDMPCLCRKLVDLAAARNSISG